MDHINDVFDTMAEMLHSNNKDTLPKCIRAFKKLIAKDWHSMTNANPEVFIRSYTTRHVYICTSTSPRVESTLWSLMRNLPVAGILLGNCQRKDRSKKSWSLSLGYSTVHVRPTCILLWSLLI